MNIGGLHTFSLSDFPEHPAAVVFCQGCNFRCPFCHNGHLLDFHQTDACLATREVLDFLATRQGQLQGVVISGGEPTLQGDLAGFMEEIKAMGYGLKLDTNGSQPAGIETLLSRNLGDFIAMDIKAPLARYDELCGRQVDTTAIRRSVEIIAKSGVEHLFRTTWVEPLLGSDDLAAIKAELPDADRHIVQPFNPRTTLSL